MEHGEAVRALIIDLWVRCLTVIHGVVFPISVLCLCYGCPRLTYPVLLPGTEKDGGCTRAG
eukprot:872329-Rhodomonas_salina.1